MAEGGPLFLSIVVPFHNSVGTCEPLLAILARLDAPDVELILVDDGSTDETPRILRDFAHAFQGRIAIVERANGGPGAARNSGLDLASGRFVWFVDSDDRIVPAAIDLARSMDLPAVDLIAWDWDHPTISRNVPKGLHSLGETPAAPDIFDPIVANWYSMAFIRRTGLRFPENCIYEATPIEAFVLPLLVQSYLAIDFSAYRGNMDTRSVTRGDGVAERHFDRLATVSLGMAFASKARLDPGARAAFEAAFVRLYLWYSIRLSKLPDRSWLLAARVMRKFRDEARRLELSVDPFDYYPGRRSSRRVLRMLWSLSAALPPQDRYFARLRKQAWGERQLNWDSPVLPRAADGERSPSAQARP